MQDINQIIKDELLLKINLRGLLAAEDPIRDISQIVNFKLTEEGIEKSYLFFDSLREALELTLLSGHKNSDNHDINKSINIAKERKESFINFGSMSKGADIELINKIDCDEILKILSNLEYELTMKNKRKLKNGRSPL